MHFEIEPRTIFLARHGSHAYGTSLPTSDVDLRGAAIAPRSHVTGFAYTFEQNESKITRDGFGNTIVDQVIYSLRKFMNLASDCNPNVLEVLFVEDSDIILATEEGRILRDNRELFLSKKVKHTFTGYAISQLKRIRTHRGYLLNPPSHKPTREEFGLATTMKITPDMMGAFDKVVSEGDEVHPNVMELVQKEKQYKAAMEAWNSYQRWDTNRNEARKGFERDYGYDTKHAMHLVRLLRMCREILLGKGMIVRRPDAKELLGIRHGEWKYEDLVSWAEQQDAEMQVLYAESTLPHTPDLPKLNDLCVELHDRFWSRLS